jgi:hypothetical protein
VRPCQISGVLDLVPSLNKTLNPVVEQANSALDDIVSINVSLRTSNIPAYITQVDSSKVG